MVTRVPWTQEARVPTPSAEPLTLPLQTYWSGDGLFEQGSSEGTRTKFVEYIARKVNYLLV